MDLTQLANLGEFIGGIAVLLTLVYLAVQMRQSNQIATTEAVHLNVNTLSTYRQMHTDDSVSRAWAKAEKDEALSGNEMVQVRAVVSELTWAGFAGYVNPRSGGGEAGESPKAIFPMFIAAEVGRSRVLREVWAEMESQLRGFGATEFADAVSLRLPRES